VTQNKTNKAKSKPFELRRYRHRDNIQKLPPPCGPNGQPVGTSSPKFCTWLTQRVEAIRRESENCLVYQVGQEVIEFYKKWGFLPVDLEVGK